MLAKEGFVLSMHGVKICCVANSQVGERGVRLSGIACEGDMQTYQEAVAQPRLHDSCCNALQQGYSALLGSRCLVVMPVMPCNV